jgi:hypothetical protein
MLSNRALALAVGLAVLPPDGRCGRRRGSLRRRLSAQARHGKWGLGLNPMHAIANTKRMRPSADDDLCRFTASNYDLLRFDYSAGVVLWRSADRLEKFPQEAY